MVLGLISDLHGNPTALNAVIDDGRQLGVDRWWVLGDLVALGPDRFGVLDRVTRLPSVEAISGNTERYVIYGDRPFPALEDVRFDAHLLDRLVEVGASFSWTRGTIAAAGWFDYLASLPSELRLTLPDGTRVLGIHASPRSDDGQGVDSDISDIDLRVLLEGCDADLVFAGHTHDATDRVIDGVRAVGLGSPSNPHRTDRCATYSVLRWDAAIHVVEHRIVDYDHRAEIEALDLLRHPAGNRIRRFHE